MNKKTKKENETYYLLTSINKIYRCHKTKIKKILVNKKICRLDGLKLIPNKEYIESGEVLELDSDFKEGEKYYKYKKSLIDKYFKKKKVKELYPLNWKESFEFLVIYSEKLVKIKGVEENYYGLHPYYIGLHKKDIELYLEDLNNNINMFTKKEQKIILVNLNNILNNYNKIPFNLDFLLI